MNYRLDFDLSSLSSYRTTGEHHDEIYMTGFGVNEFGEVDVMPLRRIKSNNLASFVYDESQLDKPRDVVRGSDIIGSPTLLSTKLPGRRNLKYQLWLWIIESDDNTLLKEQMHLNKEGLEREIRDYNEELRRLGFPEKNRTFFAVASNIFDIHVSIQKNLYKFGNKFEVFTPIARFIDCNAFVTHDTEIEITDLKTGEYYIDNRVKGESFKFINSPGVDYNTPLYDLYYDWKLVVSGSADIPIVSR